jgi:CRP/FNR family transcriptional regulator
MITQEVMDKTLKTIPLLKNAPEKVVNEFKNQVNFTTIAAGKTVFWEGDFCHNIAVVLSGRVRVYKIGQSGREITLYRFAKGETCILTVSCLMSNQPFPAIAKVEVDTQALIIPSSVFRDWIDRFQIWREFVCKLLAQRLDAVIATVDEVAFRRMDMRIAELLITKKPEHKDEIKVTHQELAGELGTAREVVSRILKDFEFEGLISLSRGRINIMNLKELFKKRKIV